MAVEGGAVTIELDEEIEGELICSKNYLYSEVGKPVPIHKSEFDPQCLPSQPLAVSERFRLLFVAHPQGFCVARTKDVIASAEEIKETGKGPSVGELSLVDVHIGKVSMMAVSVDDSFLAVIVESHVHFFAISALLHKEQKPSYSVSIDDSNSITDMKWAKKDPKAYVILSDNGKLYHGSGPGLLSCVMESVKSVDWSTKGNYVAVAQTNAITILSLQFKEKLSFLIQFESVSGDSDVNQVIKVDSLRWIRPDCIVVGCFQLNEAGEKENYIVQVITSRGQRITDAASMPVLLSFDCVFVDLCFDAVPARNGPHLFLNYLDHLGLAFIATRNLSKNVGLFRWSLDSEKNETALVEISNDAWTLHLNEYQDNDEENVLLGLCVDKVSQNENVQFVLGDEEREVSPCCIVICLTIDGKISMFHFVSAVEALKSPEGALLDEEEDATPASMKHKLPQIASGGGEESRDNFILKSESYKLSSSHESARSEEQTASGNTAQKSIENSHKLKLDEPKKFLPIMPTQESNVEKQSIPNNKSSPGFFPGVGIGNFSSQSVGSYALSGQNMEPLGKTPSRDSPSAWSSTDASRTSAGRFLSFPIAPVNNSDKHALQSTGSVLRDPTDLKDKAKSSLAFASVGHMTSTVQGNKHSVPSFPVPHMPLDDSVTSVRSFKSGFKQDTVAALSPRKLMSSAQNAPKQFGNVEEMAENLDNLLEGIEGKDGFLDGCITSQENSVIRLEEGMWALSDRCRMWRESLDDQLKEVQLLLDKAVQVLVRKAYMEGFFKQATDSRYWELWNRQNLSSELELKRKCILDLNQELTNRLIELERHFNSIEFNKFGENGGIDRNRRVLQVGRGHSRQIQSLHSLHNTMTAQLAAAEQLSGCLSEQMAVLSIESSGKQDAKKKLFESIGLSYVGDSHRSLGKDSTYGTPQNKEQFSVVTKEQSRRNQVSNAKSYEAETARRRRDSLDQSWTTFEPTKTTVKRMLIKDHEKGSASQSLLNIGRQALTPHSLKEPEVAHSTLLSTSGVFSNRYKSQGIAEKQSNESASTPLFQRRTGSPDNVSSKLSFSVLPSPSIFEKQISQNSDSEASKTIDGKLPTRPSHSTENLDIFKLGFINSEMVDQKNTQNLSEKASFNSKIPVISTSGLSSSVNASEKVPFTKSPQKQSQTHNGVPTSTSLQSSSGSSSVSSSTLPTGGSFFSKQSSIMLGGFPSTTGAGVVAKEDELQRQALVPTALNFSSSLTSSTAQNNLSSVFPSTNSKSESVRSLSQPLVVTNGSQTEGMSQIQTSVPNMPSATEKDRTEISTSILDLRGAESTISTDNSKSGTHNDIGDSSKSPSIETSITKPEQPYATETLSPTALSSDVNIGSVKNVSDASQEEEMDEEAPETDQTSGFSLGDLGGFGIGSTPNSSTERPNPFGVSVLNKDATSVTSPFTMSPSTGELFRPASFNFQSPQSPQPMQPSNPVSFTGGFGSNNPVQVSAPSGFGQPAQMGVGQQALGSVLGAFGQSRQVGAGLGGSIPSASGFGGGFTGISAGGFGGGFSSAATGSGFANQVAPGGGFAAAANAGGGFAAAASAGGGFAAAANIGGGFGAAANTGVGFSGGGFGSATNAGGGFSGGFGGAANSGGGFAAAATPGSAVSGGGGFGAFSNQRQQGGGAFSAFGGGSGAARPPSELFTQMRR